MEALFVEGSTLLRVSRALFSRAFCLERSACAVLVGSRRRAEIVVGKRSRGVDHGCGGPMSAEQTVHHSHEPDAQLLHGGCVFGLGGPDGPGQVHCAEGFMQTVHCAYCVKTDH